MPTPNTTLISRSFAALPKTTPRQRMLTVALASCIFLASCGKGAEGGPGAGGGMPPAEVGVVTVSLGDVGLVTELPGRLEASRVAQVRARAAGILQKRLFREGSDVKAGQPLFSIDPAPYAAAAASAKAGQARAEANAAQTTALAERYKNLDFFGKVCYGNRHSPQLRQRSDCKRSVTLTS